MTTLRSLVFNVAFYAWTAFCCLALVWILLLPRRAMMRLVKRYLNSVYAMERVFLNLDFRLLGREHIPEGPFILAAKHQSAWETFKIHLLFDDPAIVLKRELMSIPIWGWYARKAGMIPIDRGGRARALKGLIARAQRCIAEGRTVVIFPQGTRTAPGIHRTYQVGVAALYRDLSVPVVPMALNSGVFWPRRRFRRRPGTITIELLPPIPPGLDRRTFMARLESELETASERLVIAAGGPPTTRPAHQPGAAVRVSGGAER